MTKDSKLAHISDSASRGKGESMATEIRAKDWLSKAFTERWNCKALDFSNDHVIGESVKILSELLAEYAESESKGLASRVEELDGRLKLLATNFVGFARHAHNCEILQSKGVRSCNCGLVDTMRWAKSLLAGAHAEEKS